MPSRRQYSDCDRPEPKKAFMCWDQNAGLVFMRILRSGDGGNIFAIEINFYMCLADRLRRHSVVKAGNMLDDNSAWSSLLYGALNRFCVYRIILDEEYVVCPFAHAATSLNITIISLPSAILLQPMSLPRGAATSPRMTLIRRSIPLSATVLCIGACLEIKC